MPKSSAGPRPSRRTAGHDLRRQRQCRVRSDSRRRGHRRRPGFCTRFIAFHRWHCDAMRTGTRRLRAVVGGRRRSGSGRHRRAAVIAVPPCTARALKHPFSGRVAVETATPARRKFLPGSHVDHGHIDGGDRAAQMVQPQQSWPNRLHTNATACRRWCQRLPVIAALENLRTPSLPILFTVAGK